MASEQTKIGFALAALVDLAHTRGKEVRISGMNGYEVWIDDQVWMGQGSLHAALNQALSVLFDRARADVDKQQAVLERLSDELPTTSQGGSS